MRPMAQAAIDHMIEKIPGLIEIMTAKEMIMTEDLKITTGQGIMNLTTRKIMIIGGKIMVKALKNMIINQRITITNGKKNIDRKIMIIDEKV